MTRPSSGTHDPCFDAVVDRFDDHLMAAPFSGASMALYVGGRLVIDRWGGIADVLTGRPWDRDTMALVFSCTKSVSTIVVLHLVEQGVLDLDRPIADHWPEFGSHGKEAVTLRQVMSHRAGLPLVDAPLTLDDVLDGSPLVAALADQVPLWAPGTAHVYHAITVGAIVGETVRRAAGRSLGTILREELCGPLDLDLWIGLPEAECSRVAVTMPADRTSVSDEVIAMLKAVLAGDDRLWRALSLNGALKIPLVGLTSESSWNDARLWGIEVPAGNGIGTARSLAKLHAALVSAADGDLGGPLLREPLVDDARREQSAGPQLFGLPIPQHARWGTGFMLPNELRPMLGPGSFGHDGAAGGLVFADSDHDLGFAFLPSQMGSIPDLRANDLVDALRACLG